MSKMKRIFFIIVLVVCFLDIVVSWELFLFSKEKKNQFLSFWLEYEELEEQISQLEQLKNSYMVVLDEGKSLEEEKKIYDEKVEQLNQEILKLKESINEISNKIKNIS